MDVHSVTAANLEVWCRHGAGELEVHSATAANLFVHSVGQDDMYSTPLEVVLPMTILMVPSTAPWVASSSLVSAVFLATNSGAANGLPSPGLC